MKHGDIIQKLDTLAKAAVISSALDPAAFEEAGIPPVRRVLLKELGKAEGISYASAARTWNPALVGGMTKELVEKSATEGGRLFLTPDLKTAVNPYEEGLSEDAYLNGEMGADIIRGIHVAGASAGLNRPSVGLKEIEYLDRREDPAAIHELVIKPFLLAVKNSPCEAVFLEPLREGTGYYNTNRAILGEAQSGLFGEGTFIVGEGVNSSSDAVALLNGGITLGGVIIPLERAARRYLRLKQYEEEGSIAAREIEDSLKDGTAIDEEKIDALLDEIIDFAMRTDGLKTGGEESFGGAAEQADAVNPVPETSVAETPAAGPDVLQTPVPEVSALVSDKEVRAEGGADGYSVPAFADGEAALYRATAESVVLLKNYKILPLREGTAISVLGEGYKDLSALGEKFSVTGKAAGYDAAKARSEALIPTAVRASARAQAAIVFLRPDPNGKELSLPPNRIALLDALKKAGKRVIAVILGDVPVDMSFDRYADAVLFAPAEGKFACDVLACVLCGEINPSGRLTRTLYDRADEYFENYRNDRNTGRMNVGSFVGYRRYETEGIKVRYPFGFGASYTQFRYSGLEVGADYVSFTLTNSGKADGAEVAQVYIGVPSKTRVVPKKQLRAFEKVFLKAGESKEVKIPLPDESFETFDSDMYADNVETGEYAIYVGASALDIRLTGKRRAEGVTRNPQGDSNTDYFPDGEYDDTYNVKKENRFGETEVKTPAKLRQLHNAAIFAFPLIAVTFFLLVSVLILSYALNYILLSAAAEETVEWSLYIFAVLMLALCPLLGRFNRKRLVYSRMAALFITPVLITVCFILGAIMLTNNGGAAERICLRIITCFAVGVPIFAVVATLIERQLWRTKTGNNRWDRYYFTREPDEITTSGEDFETAFKTAEALRAQKNAESKTEETPEETEVVSFYDKSLTYPRLIEDCNQFIKERGLKVSEEDLRNYLAAVFSTRLIIVPAGGGAALCEAVAGYFGKKAAVDNAEKYRRYDDLFTKWKKDGNACPTALNGAIACAKRESAYMHTALIRHVDKACLGTLFTPVAEVLAHKKSVLPPADGKNYSLPENLVIVVEAETENLREIPAAIAEAAAVLSPVAEECEQERYKTAMQAVGYEHIVLMRRDVRDSYTVDEELWKKTDVLAESCKTAKMSNLLWIKLETHSAFAVACGAEGHEALDGALAAETMPWLCSVWDDKVCKKSAGKALIDAFGGVEMKRCALYAGAEEETK